MLQEEFSRLIYMYQEAAEGKGSSVEELFRKSLEFISHLKQQLVTGDEEDKQAALRMMHELYEHMKRHTKFMCEKAGISEEQLMARSENPANFTPEQWKKMQESKKELAHAGEDLIKLLQSSKPEGGKGKAETPESLMSKKPSRKKESKKKTTKKSNWMRS